MATIDISGSYIKTYFFYTLDRNPIFLGKSKNLLEEANI